MAVSWPVTVLVTAVGALILSLLYRTQFTFLTEKVPVKATAETAFKFISDPMFIKDVHPLVQSMKIKSQKPIAGGDYFDVAVVHNLPVVGHHAFRNQCWTNKDTLTVTNIGFPLWPLLTVNVTWWVLDEGDPGSCFIQGRTTTQVPYLLSFLAQSTEEAAHGELVKIAGRKIDRLTTEGKP